MAKRNIQVCMTPKLFSLYADKKSIVVVIDVLRATSSMCIAFEKGVEKLGYPNRVTPLLLLL